MSYKDRLERIKYYIDVVDETEEQRAKRIVELEDLVFRALNCCTGTCEYCSESFRYDFEDDEKIYVCKIKDELFVLRSNYVD